MRAKRSLLFLLVLVSILSGIAAADMISQPAATVNLIRNTVITVQDLQNRVDQYQAEATQAVNPAEILDVMINDELVLQGAERDGYMVTDAQIDQMIRQQRTYIEQQLGNTITDAQFEIIIRNNYGVGLAEFRKSIKESTIVDRYVRGTMNDVLESYEEPTDEQILEFYRANRSSFINPELVRLSHIFMPYTEENKAEVKKQMDQLSRWLRYNTYTFEELVPKYSQDKQSVGRGGDIGWLAFDDEEMRSFLGDDFFNTVFDLPLGRPSKVIETTSGFHIVKVTTHTDPKMLSIDDQINPEEDTTVREYIRQTLTQRSQQVAYLRAIDQLVQNLRDEAQIQVLYEAEGELN